MFSSGPPSLKACCHCGKEFTPRYTTTQKACSLRCAGSYAKKERLAKEKREREQDRAKREEGKSVRKLMAEADTAFMAWTRERDYQAGFLCISSGKPLDWSGNQVDAGHYRSRGAASHLRYDPDNCHAQSKYENRYRAGNAVEYRIRLIDRIGLERVLALENNNTPHHWTRDELRQKRDFYKAEVKRMRAQKEET